MDKVVELKNVTREYGKGGGKAKALDSVNLVVEEQSFTSIIGASGSGKSTLLNIIGTLDKPTSGEVYIAGRHTETMKKNELAVLRNETIGFVFQFHYLLPEFTAYENVLMPYRIRHGGVTKEAKARADELMDLMGIARVKNNRAPDMSGGQQQRTAIARALINNPRVLLADEPTGNLDSKSAEAVYAIMRDVSHRFKTTFLIVTHDDRIAAKTDRIIEIGDGRICADSVNTAVQQ